MTGTVKRKVADKGYCFIRDTSGREYFCHRSEVLRSGFDSLQEGDLVTFEESHSQKGPRATNVDRM